MLSTAVRDFVRLKPDRSALFDGLMKDSHKQAFGLALRLTGHAAEAEDLVQETFVRAFRFFHRYDESLPFTSWVYRIMANAHIDMVRRRGRMKTTSLDSAGSDGTTLWDLPDAAASPDRLMLQGTMDEPVQRALLAMTPKFRMSVLLADVEGMAYEEVAEIMDTSVGTVRSRIHRGRRQLREHLKKHSPETYSRLSNEL